MRRGVKVILIILSILLTISLIGAGVYFLIRKIKTSCYGKSAYEIAVENGFEGTEQEWLDSLVGESAVGIVDMQVDSEFHLMVQLSDGTSYDAGYVGSGLGAMTRGEWIKTLVELYGYGEIPDNMLTFDDVVGTEYQSCVETALSVGLITKETEKFEPYSYASREFIATTAVRCLGYFPEGTLSCIDASEVVHAEYAQFAIDEGFFDLENGKFRPTLTARLSEIEPILDRIRAELDTLTDREDEEEAGFVYREGVIILDLPIQYAMARNSQPSLFTEDGRLRLPRMESTENFQKDQIFELWDTSYKVVSVTIEEEYVLVEYTKPELYEVLEKLEVSGENSADISQFMPADGVELISNTAIQTFGFEDDMFDIPETSIVAGHSFITEGKIPVTNDLAIEFELNWRAPTVKYKFDVDFNLPSNGPMVNVRNAFVVLSRVKAEGKISLTNPEANEKYSDKWDIDLPDSIHLGSIPIVGLSKLGMLIDVSIELNVKGSFDFNFSLGGASGVQILNNTPKMLGGFHKDYSFGFTGEIEAGPKVALKAEVLGEDLLSFAFSGGVKATGQMLERSNGTICIDAKAGFYAKITAFEDTKIGEWLNISMKWDLLRDTPNSVTLLHIEDLERVPECTYQEKGTITGTVANADTKEYITGAKIEIYDKEKAALIDVLTSGEHGEYELSVSDSKYLIRIAADGYIPFETIQQVRTNELIYVETFLMVEGNEDTNETGVIAGKIKNTVTGGDEENVTLTIRRGWNISTGEIVAQVSSNENGYYEVELPLGNFTITMEKENFVASHFNVAVTKSGNYNQHGYISPNSDGDVPVGELRIVLTWGAEPSDLDSHLRGPNANGTSNYHIYYSNDYYYSSANGREVDLDVDDTSSYGPETVTIYTINENGKYSYYVHNYSESSDYDGSGLAESGAKVQVYVGEKLLVTYNVPLNGRGTVWHVFDYDAELGKIFAVNAFYNEDSASNVGATS